MGKAILIVEAKTPKQDRLFSILSKDYLCIEATNCEDALSVLLQEDNAASAVLLDMTTVSDGGKLLKALRKSESLAQIPVLVALGTDEKSAQIKALSSGAVSCLSKPYDPDLVCAMLNSILRLYETAACTNRWDKLTGLLTRDAFLSEAERMIKSRPSGYYVLSSFNITSFKVVNDQYGEAIGNEILKHVGSSFGQCIKHLGGICCRYVEDKFAALYPAEHMHSEKLTQCHKNAEAPGYVNGNIRIRIGRCIVDDTSLSVGTLYDRAVIAEETIRDRYDVYIAEYQESMRDRLIHEQQIVSEMYTALREDRFETWFQPQYNLATGALIGAEALVRWRHPRNGMLIPPDRFIPVFERNGFIYELDQYIWERVCAFLRRSLDDGRSPLPISVNVSRVDVLMADFVKVLTGLVKKYELPIELLRLEITESAFSQAPEQIVATIKKLVMLGFTVEIDDFGSGYSSLNTLKDVPAHIVKLDMKFIENTEDSQRGGNILESVVRMAKWLNMAVIAEGVETPEQADYLKSIGCFYVQGYLYSKPMPLDEYETLEAGLQKEPQLEEIKTVKNLSTNSFWDPKSIDTLIFNSFLGGACIFEVHNGEIEVLRVNDKYVRMIGRAGMEMTDALKLDWAAYMEENGRQRFFAALRYSSESEDEADDEYLFYNLPGCAEKTYLRATLRVIAANGGRQLVYCLIENTTALRQAEEKERETERKRQEATNQLQAILENVHGGVFTASFGDNRLINYIFVNNGYFAMFGYTRQQFKEELPNGLLERIHPDDLPSVSASLEENLSRSMPTHIEYRVRRRDGSEIWVRTNSSVIPHDGFGAPTLISVTLDVTEQKETEEHFRFLNEMAHSILAQPDAVAGINGMLRRLLDFFGADRVFIFERNDEKDTISGTYEACAEGVPRELENLQDVPKAKVHFWLNAFEQQDYVDVESFDGLTIEIPSKEYLFAHDIRSIVTVPLRRDGRVIGFIGVENKRLNHSHIARLVALGDYLAIMLTRRDDERRIALQVRAQEQMMQDIPGGYAQMRVSSDGLIPIFINEELCRLCGMTHEQAMRLYAENAYDAVHPDDVETVCSMIQKALQSRSSGLLNVRLLHGGGGYVSMRVFYRVTGDVGGSVYINGYYSDVLAQDKVDLQRRELLDNLPTGAALYAFDGEKISVIHLNKRYWELVARKPAQYQAGAFLRAVHPDDREGALEELRQAIREKREFSDYVRILYGNEGGYRLFHLTARISGQGNGSYLVYATYTPVTGHELMAQAMLPAALATMMSASADYIFVKDRELRYVCANPAAAKWLGARCEKDIKGKTNHELLERTLAERYEKNERQLLTTGEEIVGIEETIQPIGGLPRWSTVSKYPVRDEKGRIIGLLGIGRDITGIHDAAFELSTLLTVIPSGVFKYSADEKEEFSYLNSVFTEQLGYTEAQFREKFRNCFREMVYAEDRDRVEQAILEQESEGGVGRFDYRIEAADGQLRWFHNEGVRITDRTGRAWYYVAVMDITVQRESDAKLRLLANGVSGGLGSFEYSPCGLRALYINDGFFRLLGYTREEYTALTDDDQLALILEADRPSVVAAFQSIVDGAEQSAACTLRCRTRDGGYCWFSLSTNLAEKRGKTYVFSIVLYDITEQKKTEQQLRMSEESYRLATLHSNVSIGRYSIADRTLSIAVRAVEKSSFPDVLEDVPHGSVKSGDVSPDTAAVYIDFYDRILRGEKEGTAKYRRRIDGKWWWLGAHFSTLFSDEGKPVSAIISFRDITQQMEQEAVYKKWIQSLRDRPESSYTLVRCNLSKNTSFESAEGSLIKPYFSVPDPESYSSRLRHYAARNVYVKDREKYTDALTVDALRAAYRAGKHTTVLEFRELLPDGGVRWLQLTVELVEYPGSSDIVAYMLYEDIDERKRGELQTQSLAQTDPLTGLLNRTVFKEKVAGRIGQRKEGAMYALLMMDVDGFKLVNDRLGHMAGDQLLIEIGQKLRSIVRKEDLICRIGGDEFMVFLCSVPSREIVEKKAERICALLRKSIAPEVTVTVSLGISVIPNDGDDFETLYQKADLALYRVKFAGKNHFAFYTNPGVIQKSDLN